jgi:hypothetical protein
MTPSLERAAAEFLDTHRTWVAYTKDEMRFLEKFQFRHLQSIIKLKKPVVDTYQRQLKFLFDQRKSLDVLPPETKQALRNAQIEFAELSTEYQAALQMAMKMSERLVGMIQSVMTQHLKTTHFYGESGAMVNKEVPRSVTVNKKA